MKTRQSRFVRSVCACVLGLCGIGGAMLLGCGDDGASGADAAAASPGSSTGPDGGGSSSGDPPLGPPPGTPGNVLAAPTLVTTLAGSGAPGFDDGVGAAATFHSPLGLAVDKGGNVYVADSANHAVRLVTGEGAVTTLAGGGPDAGGYLDDQADKALLKDPAGVALDADGNVYVADTGNHRVRVVNQDGVSTFPPADDDAGTIVPAPGDGTGGAFNGPKGVVVVDTILYVADTQNQRIIYAALDTQNFAPLAGMLASPGSKDGTGSAAQFHSPVALAADPGGFIYVADSENHRIRRIDGADVSTPAGSGTPGFADGTGTAAAFNLPTGVAADANGNVFIADSGNHRIRKMAPGGVVTTIAGSAENAFADGTGETARFNRPTGIVVDAAGNIYVSDTDNHRIRKIVTVGPGQLVVSWSLPASGGSVTGFKVTATAAGKPDGTCTSSAETMCTLTNLTSGVPYSITVVAMSGSQAGTASAPITATPN